MAVDKTLYRMLRSGGMTGRAAAQLADTTSPYSLTPTAVTDVPPLTSTDVTAADPPAVPATYDATFEGAVRTLEVEAKNDLNALRADVEALRTRLNALLAERR